MRALYVKHKLTELVAVQKIVALTYLTLEQNFEFIPESHDFWELVYADRGNLELEVAGKQVTLMEGEVYLIEPNIMHNNRPEKKVTADIVVIGFTTSNPAMKNLAGFHAVLPLKLRMLLTKILTEGSNVYDIPDYDPNKKNMRPKDEQPIGGEQLIKIHIEELVLSLLRLQSANAPLANSVPRGDAENRLISDIVQYLGENVAGVITINDVCEKFNFSKTYLSTLFKNATGRSILSYFALLKICEAKRLIRENEHNFTEISEMLSYDTPHYFSKAFKKLTGITPQDYKRSASII